MIYQSLHLWNSEVYNTESVLTYTKSRYTYKRMLIVFWDVTAYNLVGSMLLAVM
jgi:hypothetical protein